MTYRERALGFCRAMGVAPYAVCPSDPGYRIVDRLESELAHYAERDDDVWLVLSHPRFFRIARTHWGHNGDCPKPPEDCDGVFPCWRYEVGVALREAQVDWFTGASIIEALAKVAARIRGERGAS